MRKTLVHSGVTSPRAPADAKWLALEEIARVEVTSEDPDFPIESALTADAGAGWRAMEPGEQTIRIIFDSPTTLHRIRLEFNEMELERTQEFTLRWSSKEDAPPQEIVRQQWTFSPGGSTSEVENYQVQLENLSTLSLTIRPDLNPQHRAVATLSKAQLA